MKIYFFVLGNKNATTTYSNILFANKLKSVGYNVEIINDNERKANILEKPDCDAIFFQKTIQCKAHTSKYIKHLKGKVHLIHIDDDFQDMQNEEHIETLKITDLILVGTNKHKQALKQYTDTPVEEISCMLDFDNYNYVSVMEKSNNPLIISWQQSCADAYTRDLLSIAQPLCKIVERYGVKLHLYGWHMGKDYHDHSDKVREVMPYAKFIEYEPIDKYIINIVPALAKSDIFVMPYVDIPYRWGKSGFALKRIMLMGVPIVTSDIEHNRTLIKNGENGFLASTNEQWYTALERLIQDKALREKVSLNARKLMEREYNDEAVIGRFTKVVKKHLPIL